MSEDNEIKVKGVKLESSNFHTFYHLYFVGGEGKEGKFLGGLKEVDNGQLEFEGDATESAKVFFDEVIKLNSMYIKKLENED